MLALSHNEAALFVFVKYLANSSGPNSLPLSLTVLLTEIESKLSETCVISVTTHVIVYLSKAATAISNCSSAT